MTIHGSPITDGCVDSRHAIELSCEEQSPYNGMTSCAEREDDGTMFSLASDTYRQLLEQRGGWASCSDTWAHLSNCD